MFLNSIYMVKKVKFVPVLNIFFIADYLFFDKYIYFFTLIEVFERVVHTI